MITVGSRELKQQTSEVIRLVRQEGQQIQVTYRGEVVALLVPVERSEGAAADDTWASLDVLAAEIGARWPGDVSSLEAVAEGRE